jgi:hypothetical protein
MKRYFFVDYTSTPNSPNNTATLSKRLLMINSKGNEPHRDNITISIALLNPNCVNNVVKIMEVTEVEYDTQMSTPEVAGEASKEELISLNKRLL